MHTEGGGAQPAGTAGETPGQGQDAGQGNAEWQGLYGAAVENAPEELRPHVAEYLRGLEPNFNEPFQQAAQLRQQLEPFQQHGYTDLDSDAIEGLMGFYQLVDRAGQGHQESVDDLYTWWDQVGNELGFHPEDEVGDGEEELDDGEEDDDPRIAALEQQIQEIRQGEQQREAQTAATQHYQQNAETLSKLAQADGLELSAENADLVFRLAFSYADSEDNPIEKAYADYKAIAGAGQQQLVNGTGEEGPGPSLNGGEPDTTPEEIRGWKDASAHAKKRLLGQ